MNKLALAAIATAALGAVAISSAYAGADGSGGDGVDSFQIVVVDADAADLVPNGPQLTGIALHSLNSNQPVVTAVTLPSGETVDLRHL
jgi:hypothetical protein